MAKRRRRHTDDVKVVFRYLSPDSNAVGDVGWIWEIVDPDVQDADGNDKVLAIGPHTYDSPHHAFFDALVWITENC